MILAWSPRSGRNRTSGFLSLVGRTVTSMYGHEPPIRHRADDLVLLEACPASGGSRSQMPTAQLDRWRAVVDAITQWYVHKPGSEDVQEIEESVMGWLDPVQRQIASRLFRTYLQIMPKSEAEEVDLEGPYSEVWDKERNATIGSATQFSITSDGVTSLVKIKTGRSGISPEEKSVLIEGSDDPGARIVEVNIATGVIDEVAADELERHTTIERLFAVPGQVRGRKGTVPGIHCYRCARPSRCGQYPSLEPKRTRQESRAVLVSKKWLARLSSCQRQVAWARLYGIPTDEGDVDEEPTQQLGSSFHRGLASALTSDDPDAAFAAYARSAPAPSRPIYSSSGTTTNGWSPPRFSRCPSRRPSTGSASPATPWDLMSTRRTSFIPKSSSGSPLQVSPMQSEGRRTARRRLSSSAPA